MYRREGEDEPEGGAWKVMWIPCTPRVQESGEGTDSNGVRRETLSKSRDIKRKEEKKKKGVSSYCFAFFLIFAVLQKSSGRVKSKGKRKRK